MDINRNCCMCSILEGNRRYGDADRILWESDNFFAIASIGGFIKGWTLIVPKAHQLNLRECYATAEFQTFVRDVSQKVNSVFGSTIFFEHGAREEGSIIGCGVDHAHLHIVPSEDSLLSSIAEQSALDSWREVSY